MELVESHVVSRMQWSVAGVFLGHLIPEPWLPVIVPLQSIHLTFFLFQIRWIYFNLQIDPVIVLVLANSHQIPLFFHVKLLKTLSWWLNNHNQPGVAWLSARILRGKPRCFTTKSIISVLCIFPKNFWQLSFEILAKPLWNSGDGLECNLNALCIWNHLDIYIYIYICISTTMMYVFHRSW